MLCRLFSELLGVERVGINDNFFELGGHSLLAMQLVNRVRAAFRVEVSLQDFFLARTIEDLGAMLRLLSQPDMRHLSTDVDDLYL